MLDMGIQKRLIRKININEIIKCYKLANSRHSKDTT